MKNLFFVLMLSLMLPLIFAGAALGSDWTNPEKMGQYFDIAAGVVFVASLIANATPTRRDNAVVDVIARVVDFFALNWRKR